MLDAGLLDETRGLLDQYEPQLKAMQTLGYRESIMHLQGGMSYPDMVALIQTRTRHYAKRQLTWLRKDSETFWVDSFNESGRVKRFIDDFIHR